MYEKEQVYEAVGNKNRLAKEMQLEGLLKNFSQEGQVIQANEYNSLEEADAIKNSFVERAVVAFKSIDGVGDIPLRISGEGILVPQIALGEVDADDGSKSVVIRLDTSPYDELDSFDSLEVNVKGVIGSITTPDEGEHHKINLHYAMLATEPVDASISVGEIPVPAASIYIIPTYLVECGGANTIEVISLERERASRELADELAKSGLAKTALKRKLDKLNSAFHSESTVSYSDLTNIKLLHDIGNLSNVYARRGSKYSDLLSRAVLDVMKRGRRVQIGGAAFHLGEDPDLSHIIINGSIVDVLMPESEDDNTKPAIVLDAPNKAGESELYSFAFDQINQLKF